METTPQSHRMERINELIRTILAKKIPDILMLPPTIVVTVLRVQTSRDLGHAKVFVSVFPDGERENMLNQLKGRAGDLRHELSESMAAFRVPQLRFVEDPTEKHARHIENLLDSISS